MSQDDLIPSIAEPEQNFTPHEDATVEPKPPSRIGRILRLALRWVTGAVVVFSLGVVLTWILRVRPLSTDLQALQANYAAAQAEISALKDELQNLRDTHAELESVEAELARSRQHMRLLSVLVDVTSAQLAMVLEDPVEAYAALLETDDKLEGLEDEFEAKEAEEIRLMRDRLDSVLIELETDEFAAKNDLEVLASKLLNFERSFFGD